MDPDQRGMRHRVWLRAKQCIGRPSWCLEVPDTGCERADSFANEMRMEFGLALMFVLFGRRSLPGIGQVLET